MSLFSGAFPGGQACTGKEKERLLKERRPRKFSMGKPVTVPFHETGYGLPRKGLHLIRMTKEAGKKPRRRAGRNSTAYPKRGGKQSK